MKETVRPGNCFGLAVTSAGECNECRSVVVRRTFSNGISCMRKFFRLRCCFDDKSELCLGFVRDLLHGVALFSMSGDGLAEKCIEVFLSKTSILSCISDASGDMNDATGLQRSRAC